MSETLTSIDEQIKGAAARLRLLTVERNRQAGRRNRRIIEGVASTPESEAQAEIDDALLDRLATEYFGADAEVRRLEIRRATILASNFDALFAEPKAAAGGAR